MRLFTFFSVATMALLAGCATAPDADAPPPQALRASLEAAIQADPDRSAADILAAAHKAAGGESWVRPSTLKLTGYNIIRAETGAEIMWDRYSMWRVFADEKADAHTANGKVRIEAWAGDELALLLAYDGQQTSNQNGVMENQSANAMWSNSFGFGAIRNALDEGWTQTRRPDRLIDGRPAYVVALTDPSGGKTLFAIRQSDSAVVYVGFETPRGWHERYYSNFYSKPGVNWKQPGRVRLFYNGVKANEAVWTDFEVGLPLSDDVFRPGGEPVPQPETLLVSDLALMMQWFPGVYDNHRQVYGEGQSGVAPSAKQRHTNHTFAPVTIADIPEPTLYAQQYQHYDPTDLYRQRIYSFSVDEAEDAIRLTIHTPKDPSLLTDIHLSAQRQAGLSADDFLLKPGCEVFWRFDGEQFNGYLKENACSYYSTRYEKEVFLNETLTLREDALLLHDNAVDAEGNPIFGSAERGPTRNLKQEE